ncbi:IS3 family transposase [Streptomyces sp. NPDC048664]|uniref:IS3 family transposase n=1 Tax=Streptomyces sp. NPDC048664 TaxID=3154505 RepID=UPI0034352ED2
MITVLADWGIPVRQATDLLDVSQSGYYAWRRRGPSARALRHAWLTRVILDIHASSGAVYGYRRIHEELGRRYGISVSHATVEFLMERAGIRGRPGRLSEVKPVRGAQWGRRWVVDVRSCVSPGGTLCAAVVLDTASHRLLGWSTGATASGQLVQRALGEAIARETPEPEGVRTSAGGPTVCAFTEHAHALRKAPAVGVVGDGYDHAIAETFWRELRGELGVLGDRTGEGVGVDLPEEELLRAFDRFTRHTAPPTASVR